MIVNELELCYEEDVKGEMEDLTGASPDDILVTCLNTIGYVDIVEMSRASGRSCEELVLALRGSAIFQDPEEFENDECWSIEKGWQLAAIYCSGNLRRKLVAAQHMNERFKGCFDCNVTALKKRLPDSIGIDEIHVSPGSPWVPIDIYEDFLKYLLNLKITPSVIFNKELNTWKIVAGTDEARTSVANNLTYGTVDLSAIRIFEQTMNAKTVKVYDYVPTINWKYERVFNSTATLIAQEKQNAIIREFEKWIRSDTSRAERIEECYNDTFVGYSSCKYDGSFLRFPDLNPEVTFYPHQSGAIARMLLSKDNLLLAHDVGTGKTYILCAGLHELYRMGISRKNLATVPNNVLETTIKAHKYLYPNDKILAVYPKDFTPKNRQATLEKIRDGDFVAVYMAHSTFDMIVMSKKYWCDKMSDELHSLRNAIANSSDKEEKRMLERERELLAKKLSAYVINGTDTPWLTYDSLGIETLVVDEAHSYKNIPISTRCDNIVGMHTAGSRKCREMLEKVRTTKKVVFATGTPLINSLADLYVLQSYLQWEEMRFRGISSFDMWLNTFGERQSSFEIDADGRNLRAVTRFCSFHNLTELMSLFAVVCDFYHGESVDNVDLPVFNGYRDICIKRSEAQTKYIADISKRIDLIREHLVKRTDDNMLKVTIDGRMCALDMRLLGVEYNLEDDEINKIEACASQVWNIYCEHPDTCQIVFSDIGTPKPGFNVYDSLKYELMGLGIPEHQIAFVHDATTEAARNRLFSKINAGAVRVVIGSTAKLGVGVNVQERLIAIHHLSLPWTPALMVQREGRILRRGNLCDEVYIYRYITEGTFDAYSWQLLENKQKFISSFLAGSSGARSSDDIAESILSYAEVKALAIGNPLIRTRVETSNRLERARVSSRQRQKQLTELRAVVDSVPAELAKLGELHRITGADIELYEQCKEVIHNDERAAFGEELIEAIKGNHMQTVERLFDSYQGFDVYLPANMDRERPHVYVRSVNGGSYYLEMDTEKALGCAMRIDYLLEHLHDRINSYVEMMARAEKQRREALDDLEVGNPHQAEVERLENELRDIDKRLSENSKESK